MIKLPFGWLPGHWGLKGKTRERAKAEYELTGYELELKLLELEDNIEYPAVEKKRLDILHKHGRISSADYLQKLVDLIEDDTERQIAQLELDYKNRKISEQQLQKGISTVKKEPWVSVLNMEFGTGTPTEGSFELDWNEYFVDNLKKEGYKGQNDEAIVNLWFMEVCRNVAMEEFAGTGDFEADSQANLDTMRRWQTQSEFINKDKKGYR